MANIQSKYGFNLGDRVVFVEDEDPDNGVCRDMIGSVCNLDETYEPENIGIRWDNSDSRYHECDGGCENHRGWYVPYYQVRHLDFDLGEINTDGASIEQLLS